MKIRTLILMLLLIAPALADDEEYNLGPDSLRQEGVPQGTVTKDVWHSKVFPETVCNYWVYVPKQYDANKQWWGGCYHCRRWFAPGTGVGWRR